jgi:hypothetical protein
MTISPLYSVSLVFAKSICLDLPHRCRLTNDAFALLDTATIDFLTSTAAADLAHLAIPRTFGHLYQRMFSDELAQTLEGGMVVE